MSERKCFLVISVAFEIEFVVAVVWAADVVAFEVELRENDDTRVPNFCDFLLFAEVYSKVW